MLRHRLIDAANRVLRRSSLALTSGERLRYLERQALIADKAGRLGMVADSDLRRALDLLPESESQLNQDFFVLRETGWKRDGFFVEFGATDGRTLNNTWLLEKQFGWSGILGEPARMWHERLGAAGRGAALEFDCVWSASGETLEFSEASWGELSTISRFAGSDGQRRRATSTYPVTTVSLDDLLDRHRAPETIDYLSIDTEGSEYDILRAFDFSRRRIQCITCEHNHAPNREKIAALLAGHGYRRVWTELSDFDDWYVLPAA